MSLDSFLDLNSTCSSKTIKHQNITGRRTTIKQQFHQTNQVCELVQENQSSEKMALLEDTKKTF